MLNINGVTKALKDVEETINYYRRNKANHQEMLTLRRQLTDKLQIELLGRDLEVNKAFLDEQKKRIEDELKEIKYMLARIKLDMAMGNSEL